MSWADQAIADLHQGRKAVIRPRGNSMVPLVVSGATVTLEPVDPSTLKKGDIVLVSIGRTVYLHLISATDKNRVQISNNHGKVNGWVMRSKVHGRATSIKNG